MGHATRKTIRRVGGRVRLVINLPAIEVSGDRLILGPSVMSKVRRAIRQWMPDTEAAREGGTFLIAATVQYWERQGVHEVVLVRWKAGESVDIALDQATKELQGLVAQRKSSLVAEEPEKPRR
jgi:hypothetical protein